ncbi:fibronectin type III domain-containing protein [Gabonibacter chumensis]|uniref:fibronectin type III domain-containing protein n=1 Tax=Gabonibacter chumensis TaxID=2972474 RepID=UPI0025731035|nr:fibronectin type III domain-containing protein [Gabonibacter chumensis]MCR9011114.1 fibronectin type III domain-containing protein [Gabonibacter chumensis]
MRKIRKNALKLFLFVCLGLTLTTIVYASARTNGDVPSPPGRPEILDVWDNGCTLNFLPSFYDGGSPILYYVIEYRYKNEPIWYISGRTTKTIWTTHMESGRLAQFFVRAVNEFGASEPSEASEFVLFENPY